MEMVIIFKRVITNEVLTTYLPTALLMIIVHATTFFRDEYFEANLTVNLSVMFVASTLFVSVMENLPRTSYVRMVDIWLIYGQLLPFIQVVLVTYIEACRQGKENEIVLTNQRNSVATENKTVFHIEEMKKEVF